MRRGDAGFSIVELLVAIAITSLVVLAIGGLLTLGLKVRERADENMNIEAALVDLHALATLAGSEVGMSLRAAGDEGFELERGETLRWMVALDEGPDAPAIELRRGERASLVELSGFEAVSLEYLVPMGAMADWVTPARTGGQPPLAARLRLSSGDRVWRPLVWIASDLGERWQ